MKEEQEASHRKGELSQGVMAAASDGLPTLVRPLPKLRNHGVNEVGRPREPQRRCRAVMSAIAAGWGRGHPSPPRRHGSGRRCAGASA